jgi:hypothetical protein
MTEASGSGKVLISKADLEEEARIVTEMLAGKSVRQVWRHRPSEIAIVFTDGSTLFVDARQKGLELSIT